MVARMLRWYITLVDSEPAIWRRFWVSDQITLADFHLVLQGVMGWANQHPYGFAIAGQHYAPATATPLPPAAASVAIPLADLPLADGLALTYTYDLRDGWRHRLILEAIQPAAPSQPLPTCLEGARACPPEGSGGVWGYEDLMDRLNDTDDPDYLDLLDWLGDFDPELFDLNGINQRLAALRSPL